MKTLYFFLLLFPFLLPAQNVKKKAKVLFLGNSYTYVNNLPLLIYNIALANGDTMVYDGNLIGGYTLNNHFNDALSVSKINASPWDYVVLQAQSQEPSFSPAQVNAQTLPYAVKLDSIVKQNNACSSTVFYETWGRKNGDASNCAVYPPLCTYTGMQDRLKQSYLQFAATCNGIMSPAGEAFRRSISLNPSLELYDPDESHPSIHGSYLAAAVFYEVLFQKSVINNTYMPSGITATTTLAFLQQTAHATVTDSLPVWGLGNNQPWADFPIIQVSPFDHQMQSNSPTLTNTWYFGDGNVSNTINPLHTYATAGTYTVSHVVTNACKKDSAIKIFSIVASGLQTAAAEKTWLRAYPDPCTGTLHVSPGAAFQAATTALEISDATGRLLYRSGFEAEVDVAQLSPGLYFLKVSNNSVSATIRFIKNE